MTIGKLNITIPESLYRDLKYTRLNTEESILLDYFKSENQDKRFDMAIDWLTHGKADIEVDYEDLNTTCKSSNGINEYIRHFQVTLTKKDEYATT